MIRQFIYKLHIDKGINLKAEDGYLIYSSLMEQFPAEFAEYVHDSQISPVYHYISRKRDGLIWTVSFVGDKASRYADCYFGRISALRLKKYSCNVRLELLEKKSIDTVEEMFFNSIKLTKSVDVEFVTPCAFKSNGEYNSIPTVPLIIKSIITKWNACFPECIIEDETGGNFQVLADDVRITRYDIRSTPFKLKGVTMIGCTGRMTLTCNAEGFHKELFDMLMYFGSFIGIGIKGSLGMGGVRIR